MRTLSLTAGILLLSAATLGAQQPADGSDSAIQVARAAVATDVQNREPVGVAQSFPATVGTVYFFTTLEGDFGEARVEHVWLRDGEEVARVPLDVRGPRWRTWSTKQIPSDWVGDWTAQLVGAEGTVLDSVDFTVGG